MNTAQEIVEHPSAKKKYFCIFYGNFNTQKSTRVFFALKSSDEFGVVERSKKIHSRDEFETKRRDYL